MNPAPAEPTAVTARPIHLLAGGLPAAAIISLAGLGWLWRWRTGGWAFGEQPGGVPGIPLVVALSAVVHEALHALGWVLAGSASWRSIRLIPTWRGLGIAAVLRSPVQMTAFRLGLLVPAALLGMIPLVVAGVTGSMLTLVWGAFFLFECCTDFALLVATRAIRGHERVVSHPSELGCLVVPLAATPKGRPPTEPAGRK